jgi:Right handed beta helix region
MPPRIPGILVRVKLRTVCIAMAMACQAAPPGPPAAKPREIHPAVLFVSASSTQSRDEAEEDGSPARPFATIAHALQVAPAGALIRIGEGNFAESLAVEKSIVLLGAGPAKTKIVGAAGERSPAVRVSGDVHVELRDLAVEKAAAGVSANGGAVRMQNVSLRELADFAVSATDAEVVFVDGEILEVGSGTSRVAVQIDGGSLEMRRSVMRAAGRRAIEVRRGRGLLQAVDVSYSAVAALQVIDGGDVSIDGGRFTWFGGSALYAGAASLTVRRASVSHGEYAVVGFRGARIELRDSELADTKIANIGLVRAQGLIDHCVLARGGTEGAIAITESTGTVRLNGNRIVDPGSIGVHVTHSTVVAKDNTIVGARLDRERDLGDAVYAIDADLSLERNELRGNAGSAVTTTRSRVQLFRNRFIGNGRAGMVLLDRSSASANQNVFDRNSGPGVQIAERSAATLLANHFSGNVRYHIDAICDGGGTVDVGAGNTFAGAAEPNHACP